LETVGEIDPTRASESLLRAVTHPDLRESQAQWVPRLLFTARPGFAAQCLEELATRYQRTRRKALDLSRVPALPLVLGSSDFLARLLLRHPHWAEELRGDPPDAPPDHALEPDWTTIRIAKYQGLLRIAARDLCGRPTEQSLRELSDLADRCLRAALECAAREASVALPTLFGLGKLGGQELNFSSDVDLLFIYEKPQAMDDLTRNQEVVRLIQTFKTQLEVPSEDGFAYRVDLDLRPEGRQGVLANSVDAALSYYESFGAEWERQVLIRLRHVAGPRQAAESFTKQIEPFVYRRLIDPDAIERVRTMKRRVEGQRRSSGRDLEADLKEGPGGIRDVEFLVQALQLFYGGRHPGVRGGNVPQTLRALARLRLLPESAAEVLREAYLWLRRAEHCAQLVEERQTHRFPREKESRLALARRMGYRDADGGHAHDLVVRDWTNVRAQVRDQFESLILEPSGEHVFRSRVQKCLAETPLSERFESAAAHFLDKRGQDDAIRELEGPSLLGLARVVASQADAGRYLAHRPALLERIATAGPDSLRERASELETAPAPDLEDDLEGFLDWLRISRWDDTVLAACLDLGRVVSFEAASSFHTSVAEACVRWALEAAEDQTRPAPGQGLSMLGMGKVAVRELTYHSDLDVIFLYPDEVGEVTQPSRTAQKLINYLTTMTGAGVAYAVDSRLRPSGRQGALVSTFDAYRRYQREQAATWEHLALMRARAIAGDIPRAQRVLDETRKAVLATRSTRPWAEIADMRRRIEQERGKESNMSIALKTGVGGLMDVEFLASGGLLERGLQLDPASLTTAAILRKTASGPRIEELLAAFRFLRQVESRARWVAGRAVEIVQLGKEGSDVIAELVEPGLSEAALEERITASRREIRAAYDAVIKADTIEALS
jgi:glutamate-ammonia-ligase adenylyltransferase